MDSSTPPQLAFRRRPFTNREAFTHGANLFPNPDLVAVIIEGRGGMGKTFFLNNFDPLMAASQANRAQPQMPMLVGTVDLTNPSREHIQPLDMIYADMALPLTIEQTLIDCIEHVPEFREDDNFDLYKNLRSDYELQRRHLSFHDLQAAERRLHDAFFDAWEKLVDSCGVPLIISFDTCEYLERARVGAYFKLAESEDAGGKGLGVRAQFFDWLHHALHTRKLRNTYFIFGGRGVAGSELFRHLDVATNGRVQMIYLEGLDQDEVAHYLGLEQLGFRDPLRACKIAHLITDGLPIKLDLLSGLLDEDLAWCRRELFEADQAGAIDDAELRDRFYSHALRRFFDPASYLELQPHEQAYRLCMLCLAYARCGATIDDLQEFIASYRVEVPSERDLQTYLDGHALVKKLSPRSWDVSLDDPLIKRHVQYFLHDQLWVDIDSIFKDVGTNRDIWEFLSLRRSNAIKRCVHDVHARRRIELMCEHLMLAMFSDPVDSYRFYTSYVEQALRNRDVDGAIVISETFWRTLYYETSGTHGRFFPVLSALIGSPAINPEQIDQDERVRHLRILSALSFPDHVGSDRASFSNGSSKRAHEALEQARALEQRLARACSADQYLRATLDLGVVDIHSTYDPYDEVVRSRLRDLTERLDIRRAAIAPAKVDASWRNADEPLFSQRRDLILARALRYRSELNEALRHFEDVERYADESLLALKRYSEHYGPQLNDDVAREEAFASLSLARALARKGRVAEVQHALRVVRQHLDEAHLSTYDQVVALARYAIVSAELDAGRRESKEALEVAQKIGVRRTLELARLAHLAILRTRRKHPRIWARPGRVAVFDHHIDKLIKTFVDDEDRLVVSPDLHYEVAHEVIRAYRDRFVRQYDAQNGPIDMQPIRRAYSIASDARLVDDLHAAQQQRPYRAVQYVDTAETRISLFTTLIMVLHRRARFAGQPAPTRAALDEQLRQMTAAANKPISSVDVLYDHLAQFEALLLSSEVSGEKASTHDRFLLVVLARIAFQRGLLLLHDSAVRANIPDALESVAQALSLAELFSALSFREKRAFQTMLRRIFECPPAQRVVGDEALAEAAASLTHTPPERLFHHVPAYCRAELPGAWATGLGNMPASVRQHLRLA